MAEKGDKIWVVGQFLHACSFGAGVIWSIEGVYETEQEAVDNCLTPEFFVGPIIFGQPLDMEPHDWEGVYYPHLVHVDDQEGRRMN